MNPQFKIGAMIYQKHEIPISWELYFQKIGRYNGCLFVDIKQIVARKLRENKVKYESIATYLQLTNHSSAQHLVKKRKSTNDYKQVEKHFEEWIENGVYPYTIVRGSGHSEPKEGFNYLFKLVKI